MITVSTAFLEYLMHTCVEFSLYSAAIAGVLYLAEYRKRIPRTPKTIAGWKVRPVFISRPHSGWPKIFARMEYVKVRMVTP